MQRGSKRFRANTLIDVSDYCVYSNGSYGLLTFVNNSFWLKVIHNSKDNLQKPSAFTRHAGYSEKSMGPPEGVGLGGNSGPAPSVYTTLFRRLVVVWSTTASPALYGYCSPTYSNHSTQPCRWREGLGWCIAVWRTHISERRAKAAIRRPAISRLISSETYVCTHLTRSQD